ncbi:guanine nucleotide-binding protein G(i) subunit alpha-3-like isoform X1 [Mercenaria mercenaria]|uniref:guanine nucleotide-binding protein G(i) subunit alpha-3-like isoform X1 n=1 Tax=Mercenaria mercenaria TaxID=6596 RepID=UPI00234EA6A9|nr:guanine nucleotide-binding protein G(i) subunit alpha-3-like isoform X1 [Mercenaria mercenaria]
MDKKKSKGALKKVRKTLSLSAMGKISRDAIKRSKSIDNQLQADKDKKQNELSLLLLGGACCGKSTFVKQLRIHYGDGFPEEERLQYKNQVHENISGAANKIIDNMQRLKITFETESMQSQSEEFQRRNPVLDINEMLKNTTPVEDKPTSTKGANCLLAMACNELTKRFAYLNIKCNGLSEIDQKLLLLFWTDTNYQKSFRLLQEMKGRPGSLTPQEIYFCDNMERMLKGNYVPTHQDILFIRRPTLGVIEHIFHVDDLIYRVIDVAGQKSQRKKWIHLFESVTVVLFFVALSAFDEVLEEDETLNCLTDSLNTFHDVSHNHYLDKTDFLLFLNKHDLFTEKLKSVKFKGYVKSYDGENSPDACVKFIRDLFHQHHPCHKQVYTHVSCATDVEMMSDILAKVLDIVAEINVRKSGTLF